MKLHDASELRLNTELAAVKFGHDPAAARCLIEYFYYCIHEGEPYNERVLLEFLHHAFEKIIKQEWSADHAFGLKLKRGMYERPDTTLRDLTAAAYVILLMRRKWTWQDAKGEAANLWFEDGSGDKAVEKAHATYKCALDSLPDESLKDFLPEGTPLISRDMSG